MLPVINKVFKSKEFFLLIFLVALIVIVSIASPFFLSINNLAFIAQQISEVGMMSMAMMLVIITGGIDFSLGAIAGFSGVVIGLMLTSGANIWLAAFSGILASTLCGAFNGYLIGKKNISSLLATLSTSLVFSGIGIVLSKGQPLSDFPTAYFIFGQGNLGYVPVQFIGFLIITAMLSFILYYTPWGRKMYLIGENRTAAAFSGINTDKILLHAYTIAGLLSGITAVILTSRLSTARADLGNSYMLQSLAAAVLGGADLKGGRGTIIGAVIGATIFVIINNGLTLLNFPSFMQVLLPGLILIVILLINNSAHYS